jgi:hypothetical protein
MNLLRKLFLAVCLSAAVTVPALAWDDVGHKISAYIAWNEMTPAARESVIRILRAAPEDSQLATFYMQYGPEPEEVRRREYFELVATWADIVRDRAFETRYKKYHHSNWHYSDTFWRQVNGRSELLPAPDEGGQAVTRLYEFEKVLRDASASDRDKAIAIAWMMHLIGDLHQPLHTSARVTELEPKGDQGGNLFLLTPQGTPRENQVNLHWFWDSIVGRNMPLEGGECGRTYIESVGDKFRKRFRAAAAGDLELGRYSDWQKESFALAQTDVFTPGLVRFAPVTERYKRNAFRLAERQLALAGYRMAATFNAIFGAAPQPK